MKQILIYVNGKFQFSVSTETETYAEVAATAHKSMALSDQFRAKFAPGLINFSVK